MGTEIGLISESGQKLIEEGIIDLKMSPVPEKLSRLKKQQESFLKQVFLLNAGNFKGNDLGGGWRK